MYPIKTNKIDCMNCYKCIGTCKVNAIKLHNGEISILKNRCVLCGECIKNCPKGVLSPLETIVEVSDLISKNENVIAIIDPSYKAAFGTKADRLFAAMKKLGFSEIYDTSLGSDLVTEQYIKYIKENEREIIFTSACPTANLKILKYYKDFVNFLVPVEQPGPAMAKLIKLNYPDAKVVHICPCLSFFGSNIKFGKLIDETMTFSNLQNWMENEKINFFNLEQYKPKTGSYGRLYPTENGIIKNIKNKLNIDFDSDNILGYTSIAVNSIDEMSKLFKAIKKGKYKKYFIEIYGCKKACMSISIKSSSFENFTTYESELVMKKFAKDTENLKQLSDFSTKNINIWRELKPENLNINEYHYEDLLEKIGTVEAINEVNCQNCGYRTCKEYALALKNNFARHNLCDPYKIQDEASDLDQKVTKTNTMLFIFNEEFKIIEVNSVAAAVFNVERSKLVDQHITNIIDRNIFENIFETKKSIYNQKIRSKTLGIIMEYSLIYTKEYNIVVAVFRDITDKEIKEEKLYKLKVESVSMAQQVIDKQMVVAQQIASLLGETTAETKTTLNKLKKLLLDEGVNGFEK